MRAQDLGIKLCLLMSFFACSNDQTKKESSSSAPTEQPSVDSGINNGDEGDDNDNELGSDEPADTNALFLTLSCEGDKVLKDGGRYELICRVLNKSGENVSPVDFAASYSWKIVGSDLGDNASIVETSDALGYAVKVVIGDKSYVTANVATGLEISLAYVDKKTNASGQISKRITEIYTHLANQKYFRMVIFSVRDHDSGQAIQFLDKMSLKVDGQWLDLTLDPVAKVLKLGDKVLQSNGDLADIFIFLNIFGQNTPVLPATSFARFNHDGASFNATVPLTLAFGDGKPATISGFRYNDGMPLANKNVAAGFPDGFQFETSVDQETWNLVKGSKIEINSMTDQDVFDYVWNGYEQ